VIAEATTIVAIAGPMAMSGHAEPVISTTGRGHRDATVGQHVVP